MRIARPVGKGVMATVDGDPADDLTLRKRGARRRYPLITRGRKLKPSGAPAMAATAQEASL
jgi:hypothetical protein